MKAFILCLLFLLVTACATAIKAEESTSGILTLESDLAYLELVWPTFLLFPKWPNGTIFVDEWFSLTFMSKIASDSLTLTLFHHLHSCHHRFWILLCSIFDNVTGFSLDRHVEGQSGATKALPFGNRQCHTLPRSLTKFVVSEGGPYSAWSSQTNSTETLWDSVVSYTDSGADCSTGSTTVTFMDGSPALRNFIACNILILNGSNTSLVFSMYNISGQLAWGPRYVNISYDMPVFGRISLQTQSHSAGQLTYETLMEDWPFVNEYTRLQVLANITITTSSYGYFDPFLQVQGGIGYSPYKHFDIICSGVGPLYVEVYLALWSLIDDPNNVQEIQVIPNPFRWPPGNFTFAGPNGGWVIAGFALPLFRNYSAWDPSVLVSLFENNAPTSPSSHALQIAVGVIVPVVILAAAAGAVIYYFHRQKVMKESTRILKPKQQH